MIPFISKNLLKIPSHIEVQMIADKHGNYAHLFERECSIQRRHQKIIEEAPSSFVDPETRNKITQAGVNAAKACNYYNAGTIEFLMDKNKDFYFLEMNTRLQVEHPVTELISGIDFVKEQISIASGNRLSFKQEDLFIKGHAIESRIYAEDAENNFLPSTGKLNEYEIPSGPGIRVDSGFSRGSDISIYYDPLIAKLVCWSSTRKEAISRMIRALKEYRISGVTNNIPFLLQVFVNKNFVDGNFDINFIEKEELVKKFQEEKKDGGKGLEEIVSAFSAILKHQPNLRKPTGKKFENSNKWTELKYE